MFTKLHIRGFKRLRDVALDLRRITVLVGPNNAGKSSVLQFLAVLKQSLGEDVLKLDGPLVQLGEASDVLAWESENASQAASFLLQGELMTGTWAKESSSGESRSAITYWFAVQDNGELTGYTAQLAQDEYAVSVSRPRGEDKPPQPPAIVLEKTKFDLRTTWKFGSAVEVAGYQPTEGDGIARRSQGLDDFLESLTALLSHYYLVPDLRAVRHTVILPLEDIPPELATEEHVISTLHYDDQLARQVSEWLLEVSGQPLIVRAAPGRNARVESEDEGGRRGFANVGGGMYHLVHLLTQLADASAQACIGIEEPESHLHPLAQAKLARLLAREAKNRDLQLLLTTHSEHLLTTLLTEVAAGRLSPEDIALYYCEPDGVGMKATPMPVDERGFVEGGLRGFFDAGVAQLTDYLRAVGARS